MSRINRSLAAAQHLPDGTGAEQATVADDLRERVSIFRFIPQSQRAAILNRTTVYDAGAVIQKALDYLSSVGGGILDCHAGLFLSSQQLYCRSNVTIEGPSACEIRYTGSTGSLFEIISLSQVVVRGITLNANNFGIPGKANEVNCIEVLGSTDVDLSNLHLINAGRDGVYIGETGGVSSKNVRVRNSGIDRVLRNGVSVVSAENVIVEDNTITNWQLCGVDCEPNAGTVMMRDVSVRGNRIERPSFATSIALSATVGSATADATKYCRVKFVGNTVIGNATVLNPSLIRVNYIPYSIVSQNFVEQYTQGILLDSGTIGCVVSDNVLRNPSTQTSGSRTIGAIMLAGNTVASNNIVDGAGYCGFVGVSMKGGTVTGNVARNTGQQAGGTSLKSEGFYFVQCEDCTITGNVAIDNQSTPTMARSLYLRVSGRVGLRNVVCGNNWASGTIATSTIENPAGQRVVGNRATCG